MGKMWLDIRYEIYLNPEEIREAETKLAQTWHSLLVTGGAVRYWAKTMESCMMISSIHEYKLRNYKFPFRTHSRPVSQ